MQPIRPYHPKEDSLQVLKYPGYFFPGDASVELLEVLQAHCHILADEFGTGSQVLHRPDPLIVELLGLLRAHPPHALQLLAGTDLVLLRDVLQLADVSSLDELPDLIEDCLGQPLHLPEIVDSTYLLGVAFDLGDGADILELPGVGLRVVRVDIVELL